MRYLLFITTDPEGETVDESPEPWVVQWNTQGVRIEGMQLTEPQHTRSVRARSGERLVTNGPFAETAEWIAGYDLITCTDLDVAIEVAASHPMATAGRIEIRPVAESDGFGAPTAASTPGDDEPAARYLLLLRSGAAAPGTPRERAAVAQWVRDGLTSRRLVAYAPLTPAESATVVRIRGGELVVTDGTSSAVTGVAFVDGEWDEALDYVAGAPLLPSGGAELREFLR